MPAAGTGFGEAGAAGAEETGGTNVPAEGGFAPTVKPAMGGKGGRAEPKAGISPDGGFAPIVNPGIGGREAAGAVGETPAGELLPTGEGILDTGFLISGKATVGLGDSVILISGMPPGAAAGVDFLVAKIKINLVPISAFSAMAVPP